MWQFTNQVAPGRAQTNSNDSNSKFQTNDPSEVIPNGIIIARPGFVKPYEPTVVNVLVIEY